MKTRQDLIRRALMELKVLAAGQSPSAEDSAVVDEEVVPVLSDLAKREIYGFGDPDQIEDEAFVHLAVILGNSVAGSFGAQPSEEVRLMSEARLRHIFAPTLSYQTSKAEFY